MPDPLRFTVLGGYLGAGKTTLLNHLLEGTEGLRAAVVVNDFGDVNVDAALIARHDGDTIELSNGCLCCSLADGLAQVLGALKRRAASLDHVFVEASGVADPARIAEYGAAFGFRLDAVLVLVDAEQGMVRAEDPYVGDTVRRQIAQADLLVLNKVDLVSEPAVGHARAWLGGLAPGTPVMATVRGRLPLSVLLGEPPRARHSGEASHPVAHESWTIERGDPVSREQLAVFAASLPADVYRAKGLVRLRDDPDHRYVFQQVGRRWELERATPWGAEARRTVLVAIGRPGAANRGSLAGALSGAGG